MTTHYDLVAIGSGRAGRHAAMQAAALGKRAAVVERGPLGGRSTNLGALPSQTLRTAIMELTGQARGVYGNTYRRRMDVTVDDLLWRTPPVIERARDALQDELRRASVDMITGRASFVDAHTLVLDGGRRRVTAEQFVIAVGTTPIRPAAVDFDDRTVLDEDGVLGLARVPSTLIVVGGSVAGLELASMAAALGVRVTLIDARSRVFDFLDSDIAEALQFHLRGIGMVFRLGDVVEAVERRGDGCVVAQLSSGARLVTDLLLYAAGRRGATGGLDLVAAGIEVDERGRIAVDGDYRTSRRHIFAAGDVAVLGGLTAPPAEQGRVGATAAFGVPRPRRSTPVPLTLSTIPEISRIGRREQDLREHGVPYVAGIARYRELARADIAGDYAGLAKLLVHARTRRLLGAHLFGTSAAELVHLAHAAMAADFPIDQIDAASFDVPSYADGYRIAALDAMGRLDAFDAFDRAARAA